MFITVIGYSAALAGLMTGALLACFCGGGQERLRPVLMGFAAGVLIAFVCFQMLPPILAGHGPVIGIGGVILGALLSARLERRFGGAVFAAGIMLHGIPEGIALGNMLYYNFSAGLRMAAVLAIHFIPEALALFGYLRISKFLALPAALALAVPVGIGAALGGALYGMSNGFSHICLAATAGIMIYLACGQILPEAATRRQAWITAAAAAAGFAAGVCL